MVQQQQQQLQQLLQQLLQQQLLQQLLQQQLLQQPQQPQQHASFVTHHHFIHMAIKRFAKQDPCTVLQRVLVRRVQHITSHTSMLRHVHQCQY